MPHLEGWAEAGDVLFLPAIGRHELLVLDRRNWQEVGRVAVHGQPVFAVARPDGRQVWVNFAHPDNDVVQVIDVPTRQVVHDAAPRPGGAAPRVHAARGAGLDLGARCRPGPGLRHAHVRAPGDHPCGQAERHLSHRARPQDRPLSAMAQAGHCPAAIAADPIDRRLLDEFQRDFPLKPRPFAVLAARLGIARRRCWRACVACRSWGRSAGSAPWSRRTAPAGARSPP